MLHFEGQVSSFIDRLIILARLIAITYSSLTNFQLILLLHCVIQNHQIHLEFAYNTLPWFLL